MYRVMAYTCSSVHGGAEVSLRNLLRELSADIEVSLLGVDRALCEWVAEDRPGTPIVIVPPVRNKASVGAFAAHRRAIAAARPDIFHANLRTTDDAQYALLAALSVRGPAVVAVEQLPYPPSTPLSRWLKRMTAPRLAAHVAVGDAAAREVERVVGLRPGSVRTIYNGVADCGVPPRPARRAGAVTIGTLARLDRIKGLDVLLDAVARLPRVHALVMGDGPDRAELLDHRARLGLVDRVEFAPWRDDARNRLGELDVFVLPSRNEGFPLSIVEAMLAELPVVATSVGSVAEAVVDGVTGFVVAPDDLPGLTAAIDRLVDDGALRRAFGAAGRDRALARFTSQAMARAFEALYESILR